MYQQYNYPSENFVLDNHALEKSSVIPKKSTLACISIVMLLALIVVTTIMILSLAGVFRSDDKENIRINTFVSNIVTNKNVVNNSAVTSTTNQLYGCGRQSIKPSIDGEKLNIERIIRGEDATEHSWPWMVSIRVRMQTVGLVFYCGGVLIYEDIVLTASHCLYNELNGEYFIFKPEELAVIIGLNNINFTISENSTEFTDNIYSIRSLAINKNFNNLNLSNDIGIIKLEKSVTLSSTVGLICLPSSVNDAERVQNKSVVIIGWGSTTGLREIEAVPYKLQQTQVKVINGDDICIESYKFNETLNIPLFDSETQYCLQDDINQSNACFGDSGGPLMFYQDNRWFVYGLTSYGKIFDYSVPRCNSSLPSYYTKVPVFLNWVERAISKLNNDNSTGSLLVD
jgi:secreted trypsin-like serine protease